MSSAANDLFLRECGAHAPLGVRVTEEGGREARHSVCEQPFVLVGRGHQNTLCLDDPRVSRRHAYLQVIAGQVFCIDLGGRTGVRCGGRPFFARWLQGGEEIDIGPFSLRVTAPTPEGRPAPLSTDCRPLEAGSAGEAPAPFWGLTWDGPSGPLRWELDRVLTLAGTSRRCKLRLHAPTTSRFHFCLVRTSGGLWLIDLISRAGTRVNGQPVRWARLQNGDELQVGGVTLHLRSGGPEQRALPPAPAEAAKNQAGAAGASALPPQPPVVPATEAPAPLPALALAGRALAAAPPSDLVEAPDARVLPLFQQFNLMQQQMLEQFHQTIMMLAQMFGSLQREQSQSIREELAHLHRVTRELQAVQLELAQRGGAPPTPASLNNRGRAEKPGEPNEEAGRGPAPLPPSAARKGEAPARREPPRGDSLPAAHDGRHAPAPTPAGASAAAALRSFESAPAEDVHSFLSERLAALEQERQSRWEKVLSFLRGK